MHKPLLFVLSVFASTGAAYSQPFYPNDMIPKKEILDSMVTEYLQLSGTVGMSVAIAGRETLYYSGEFGYANKEKGVKVNPFTLFRIASVSKILTGSLLAVMVDKGIIDLDKPINKYLKKPVPYGDVITARMLATHTAGIRHYQDNDFRLKNIDSKRFPTLDSALGIFIKDPLVAPPGEIYNYTSYGYTLLGVVMEAASGKPFLRTMHNMLEALDMCNTEPNHPDSLITNDSQLYSISKSGAAVRQKTLRPSYKWPGGGYLSNALDLAKFGQHHLRKSFLSEKGFELLFTRNKTNKGDTLGIGLGWVIAQDSWNRRVFFHNGSQTGGRSVLMVYPDEGLTIAVLSNTTNQPILIEGFASSLIDVLLQQEAPLTTEDSIVVSGAYDYILEEENMPPRGEIIINTNSDKSSLQGAVVPLPSSAPSRLPIKALHWHGQTLEGKIIAKEGILPILLHRDDVGNLSGQLFLHDKQEPKVVPVWLKKKVDQKP